MGVRIKHICKHCGHIETAPIRWRDRIASASFWTLMVFALFGAFVGMITLHEHIHKWDFEKVTLNQKMCLLIMPQTTSWNDFWASPMGYYDYEVLPGNEAEFIMKSKVAELRAGAVTPIPLVLFAIALGFVLIRWSEKA